MLCNGAFRLDEAVPAADLIEQADAWFGARGRGYTIWARAKRDDDLVAAAERAGLLALFDTPEMVCDHRLPDVPLPDGVEIRWVEDAGTIADFVTVNDGAYAELGLPAGTVASIIVEPSRFLVPHVRSAVAYLDGAPVAAAQTVLSHSAAGVYWVGTRPDARGRGIGEAVTRAVTNLAFDLGAPANTLQASTMGEPIYTRMGYRTLFRYQGLVRFVER